MEKSRNQLTGSQRRLLSTVLEVGGSAHIHELDGYQYRVIRKALELGYIVARTGENWGGLYDITDLGRAVMQKKQGVKAVSGDMRAIQGDMERLESFTLEGVNAVRDILDELGQRLVEAPLSSELLACFIARWGELGMQSDILGFYNGLDQGWLDRVVEGRTSQREEEISTNNE